MEGGESPLDVLSRAATMVQENQTGTLAASDDSANNKQSSNKQLPTAKWKRDRRSRLPEYSRKSESSKINETSSTELDSDNSDGSNPHSSSNQENAPLDMSVRQRGLPPSYAQTISNPNFRSSYRPNLNNGTSTMREELPPGISMCDPIIDEHFRRSLGNDYLTLFSNNNVASNKEAPPVATSPKSPKIQNQNNAPSVIELMDSAGLSVDDHFAKALGDTWIKLNKKEQEIKTSGASEKHSLVTI